MMIRPMWKLSVMSVFCLLVAGGADAPRATTIDVWPGPAPGEKGDIGAEKADKNAAGAITGLTNVSKPTLSVFRPARDKDTGVAVVVFPGGGYNMLAWDHVGEQVARWLNSIGVTAAVLKYRVPRREGTPKDQPPPQALMDAQRALSLVRSKAADWGIDPKRLGVLGFSAGGHLATAWTSTNFRKRKRSYEPIDEIDRVDIAAPDFAVLIYPGGVFKKSSDPQPNAESNGQRFLHPDGVVKKDSDHLAPEIRITSQTPPMFSSRTPCWQ